MQSENVTTKRNSNAKKLKFTTKNTKSTKKKLPKAQKVRRQRQESECKKHSAWSIVHRVKTRYRFHAAGYTRRQ